MKYMVLHFSQNWMMDGLATSHFSSLAAAEKHVREFKSKSTAHKDDHIKIVGILGEYDAQEIDHGLYGFKVTRSLK